MINKDATGTFQLNNVKADAFGTLSKNQVKVAISGNTTIKNTVAASNSILDSGDGTGTFGNVVIFGLPQPDGSTPDLSVQLAGTFVGPVIVAGQATMTALPGATVGKIQIATLDKNTKVILQGTINRVDVLREGHMEIADGSAINTITIYADTSITVDKTATVGGITKVNNAKLSLDGDGVQNVGSRPQ